MKQDIKLCIFDMDGTLLDTEKQVWLKGETYVAGEMGHENQFEFFRSVLGSGFEKLKDLTRERFGDSFDSDLFIEKLYKYYEDYISQNIVPQKMGGKELLDFLKQNNIKIALGTSTERRHVKQILTKLDIYDYFDNIVCGDEVINGKPNPETFLKSQEKLSVPKENCLILEDSVNGLKTAKNANIKCAIVKDIYPYKEHDLDDADYVFDDFFEVIEMLK